MWPMLIMLAGSAMQAGSQAYGATQSLKQSKYQQDILDYQAKYVGAAAKIEEAKIDKRISQTKSAQRAAAAASGFQSYAGTDLELQIDTDIQGAIDKAILRQAGGIEQLRLRNAGTMTRAQGYGVAAGLYGGASGSLLNTGMFLGARQGWFQPSTSAVDKPLLSSGYGVQR